MRKITDENITALATERWKHRPLTAAGRDHDVAGQADADGMYDSQLEVDEQRLRAKFMTRQDGSYCIKTIAPCGYAIPVDGRVGRLIKATEILEMRPAHVHFLFDLPGYERLITHLFRKGADYLENDVVFGTKEALSSRSSDGDPARRRRATSPSSHFFSPSTTSCSSRR